MIKRILILLKIASVILACTTIESCRGRSVKAGMLIVTEAPGKITQTDYISTASGRYLPGTHLIAFNPEKPASYKILTEDFYSASFPEISYDGRHMIFTAQQKQDDTWQIWEMNLDNLKFRKITSHKENSTDPSYLPGGRIVFSKITVNDTVKTACCLYTCNLDGSDLRQITFSPNTNFATTVLRDGRLLTVSRQLIPYEGEPMLTVMRPDGTKADMFYRGPDGSKLTGGALETADGRIVFIESENETDKSNSLISIDYSRPLYTRKNLSSGINGDFYHVLPLRADKYLVSFRKSDSELFALYDFDPEKKSLGEMIFSDPDFNVLDVVQVEKYERPKNLPSEVDHGVKTGLLLCQDINYLNPAAPGRLSGIAKAGKIEVLGVDTTYGVVQVEEDGSFYLKVMADTPFRIRTIDENGNVINGPCSWLWLRPNERRGCVGCHEDPEIVPDNRVSFAVKKPPVIIPVNISEVKEKIIELE